MPSGMDLGDLHNKSRFEVPALASLPRNINTPLAKCGCKKFRIEFHGDHTGGSRILFLDLSVTHDLFGNSSHP